MRCPSCLTVITESVDSCPTCKFALAKLDKVFGTVPRHPKFVNDMSNLFEERQQRDLEQKLSRMERIFPGLYVSVVTMEVNPRFKPREYVFWLVNRGRFAPGDQKLERSLVVVLFFDTLGRRVFLTTGYGLEAALPEEKLQVALETGIAQFERNRFYPGSLLVIKSLSLHLKSFCKGRYRQAAREKDATLANSTVNEFQNAL